MVQTAVKRRVRLRAGNRCEYCKLPQDLVPYAAFHIDHIIARQHEGGDEDSNLALSCYHCNSHKGPNIAGIDPDSGEIVPLFHPRQQRWSDHFQTRGIWIIGLTPTGRATVQLLSMNADDRLRLRANLEETG